MGLRETLQNAAITAFAAAGNVAESARYEQQVTTAYDVSSGTTSVVASSAFASFVFSAYDARRIDNHNILPTDVRALTPRSTFPFTPKNDDLVVRTEAGVSVTYEVVGRTTDEAGATWEFQLRKP